MRLRLTRCIESADVNDGVLALLGAVIRKARLKADQQILGVDRQLDLVLHEPSARLEQTGRDHGLERYRFRVWWLKLVDDVDVPRLVRGWHFKPLNLFLEFLVEQAETIALGIRHRIHVADDARLCLAFKAGRGGAV